jgi:hypothetical protein
MISDHRFSPPKGGGIRFGQSIFTEPELLPAAAGLASFLANEGVYVILIEDPLCSPRPFRAVYFGEAENMRSRATAIHENFPAWRRQAGLIASLYRSFHGMPGSTQRERQLVESALITRYNPACNRKLSFDLLSLLNRK